MTDSKHTNDNNSLFTRIQVKSPCADRRYSAGEFLRAPDDCASTPTQSAKGSAGATTPKPTASGWPRHRSKSFPHFRLAGDRPASRTRNAHPQQRMGKGGEPDACRRHAAYARRGAQLIYPEKNSPKPDPRDIPVRGSLFRRGTRQKTSFYRSGRGSEKIKIAGYEIQYRGPTRFGDHHHHAAGGSVEVESRLSRSVSHGSQPAALV